jgi:hypothetical protein
LTVYGRNGKAARMLRPGRTRVLLVLAGPLLLAGCTGDPPAALPPGPGPASTTATATPAVTTPSPNDREAARTDPDAGRSVSPAQGVLTLTDRSTRPAGAAAAVHDAYLGWVRASLTAFARPGEDEGGLTRYASPELVQEVRRLVGDLVLRGWAEYGSASVSAVTVRVQGATAEVSACLDLSGLAARDAAGRLARRATPVRSVATLTRSGPRWLVTADRRTPLKGC